ncbi:NAD(P)/FAD-dependent oxidoreductase [Natribaculum luteum]|uniref:NAD(P)/FAD-dependent oxidoreductase n=1 Tax=Natribaculum luteum TaxID=1586232 RepID=A0ABD5NVL1_9EURY|nr:NAD(P)/FAD-dependent oxidoreductase [Natribaculum luteum]
MDVAIIGGGPAGLSAAVYTARADQETYVFDDGSGTTREVDTMENVYGFPDGVTGPELVSLGQRHATKFGATILEEEVVRIGRTDDDAYEIETTENRYQARGVVIATGASYESPAIRDVDEYEGRGVSYCVECDAYFYRDRPVAVVGSGNFAAKEALMLLDYTDDVQVLTNGKEFTADAALRDQLDAADVAVRTDRLERVDGDDALERIVTRDGDELEVDGLFVALGAAGGTALAEMLGVATAGPYVETDDGMGTNVPRVYAAGDVTGGQRQINTSIGEGTRAAINLLEEFRDASEYVDYQKLDRPASETATSD